MSIKKAVHDSYEKWSQIYDSQENPTRDLSTAVLKTTLPPLKNLKIVEAGCGTGGNTQWLASQCEQLIGLDFSESMLALAKEKVKAAHVQFEVQDLLDRWAVADGWADIVLVNLVIEHIENLKLLLQQAHRVIKVDGQLFITEYHPDRVKRGSGAEFVEDGDAITEIMNFWHPVESYLQLAAVVGFDVERMQAWRKTLDVQGNPVETDVEPLLLSVNLRKL